MITDGSYHIISRETRLSPCGLDPLSSHLKINIHQTTDTDNLYARAGKLDLGASDDIYVLSFQSEGDNRRRLIEPVHTIYYTRLTGHTGSESDLRLSDTGKVWLQPSFMCLEYRIVPFHSQQTQALRVLHSNIIQVVLLPPRCGFHFYHNESSLQ